MLRVLLVIETVFIIDTHIPCFNKAVQAFEEWMIGAKTTDRETTEGTVQ